MRHFKVERYGREGQPIYSDDKEHTLIAWMLSIYAIIMELSDIAKARTSSKIAFTGPLGQPGNSLVVGGQKRTLRDKLRKLAPVPRSFPSPAHRARVGAAMASRMTPGDDMGGLSLRSRVGTLTDRPTIGRIGRAQWDKTRMRGKGIPQDYD
jgi:hypothetical protein